MTIGTAIIFIGILYFSIVSRGFRKLLIGLSILSIIIGILLFMQVEYRTFYDADAHEKHVNFSNFSDDDLTESYLRTLSDQEIIKFCSKNVCPKKLKHSGRIIDPEILKQLHNE